MAHEPDPPPAGIRSLNFLRENLARLDGYGDCASPELDFTLALLDTARVIVLVLGPDGAVIYCNPFFEELSGHRFEDLQGKNWFATCIPEGASLEVEDVFRRAISGIPTRGHVNMILLRDGSQRAVQWHDRTLRDPTGNITGLLAIGHDVTEASDTLDESQAVNEDLEARVQARTSALKASEDKYRELLETLDECIYRMSLPGGTYEYMAPSALKVFGYPAATFLDNPRFIAEIIGPKSRAYFQEKWTDLVQGVVPPTYEYQVRQPDGTDRWILQSNKAVRNPDGLIVAIEGICRDVTELRETQRRFSTSHQLLEGSFDASTVAVAYLDCDMNFLRVNRAYAAADDKDPEFFVGKNHFELFPNEDNERIFARVRDTGEAHSVLARPFEYAANPERGVTHWDWTLTPVKEDGVVTGLVLALRDVTGRVKAIEALQESEKQIAAQLAEKEVLLREVHHRVKNNLQVISSLLSLQSARTGDADIRRLFDESRDRVQAMALVHETLYGSEDLSRVDFGRYLSTLAPAILSSYSVPGESVSLHLSVDVEPLDIERAIPCGLIAAELLSNAIKYAFAGRAPGRIVLSLTCAGPGELCLCVADDGVGLDPAVFSNPDTLGLKLIKTLATQLGASVELRPSDGTEFRVTFPRHGARRAEA